ncbi:hypothetical protein F5H01DRAFT_352379 [Linnemannia elongata]|nr:hypothetical protein F5H01DRAFT_352379 [Linnemannia elongata]
MNIIQPGTDNRILCTSCSSTFNTSARLDAHLKDHHHPSCTVTLQPSTAITTITTFTTEAATRSQPTPQEQKQVEEKKNNDIVITFQRTEEPGNPFQCPPCSNLFQTKSAFLKHFKSRDACRELLLADQISRAPSTTTTGADITTAWNSTLDVGDPVQDRNETISTEQQQQQHSLDTTSKSTSPWPTHEEALLRGTQSAFGTNAQHAAILSLMTSSGYSPVSVLNSQGQQLDALVPSHQVQQQQPGEWRTVANMPSPRKRS